MRLSRTALLHDLTWVSTSNVNSALNPTCIVLLFTGTTLSLVLLMLAKTWHKQIFFSLLRTVTKLLASSRLLTFYMLPKCQRLKWPYSSCKCATFDAQTAACKPNQTKETDWGLKLCQICLCTRLRQHTRCSLACKSCFLQSLDRITAALCFSFCLLVA